MGGGAELIHATAVAIGGRAVLIRGPAGSGKSDLALRCLALGASDFFPEGARLVSDDQVLAERSGDRLLLRAPEPIRGKIEVRGIGVMTVPAAAEARLALVADLTGPQDKIERLPDPALSTTLMGLEFPLLLIRAFEASAPAKLMLALSSGLPKLS